VKHAQNLIILAYLAQLVCNCKRATVSQWKNTREVQYPS
jgi:hypothetical protein